MYVGLAKCGHSYKIIMHRKILFTLAALAFMATTPAAADGYRDMVKQLIATSSGGFGTVITQLKTMQADE